jgi:hypothetical protein
VLLRTDVLRASDQDSWRRIAGIAGVLDSPLVGKMWAKLAQPDRTRPPSVGQNPYQH